MLYIYHLILTSLCRKINDLKPNRDVCIKEQLISEQAIQPANHTFQCVPISYQKVWQVCKQRRYLHFMVRVDTRPVCFIGSFWSALRAARATLAATYLIKRPLSFVVRSSLSGPRASERINFSGERASVRRHGSLERVQKMDNQVDGAQQGPDCGPLLFAGELHFRRRTRAPQKSFQSAQTQRPPRQEGPAHSKTGTCHHTDNLWLSSQTPAGLKHHQSAAPNSSGQKASHAYLLGKPTLEF